LETTPIMPAKSPPSRIEKTLASAEQALQAGKWFEAESLAVEALDAAIAAGAHGLAADACLPLQEARRQRRLAAIDIANGQVQLQTQISQELESADPGVHLVVPHGVGADARRLRVCAFQTGVPALVVCREPETMDGRVPIVAIGPVTVRAKVDPPADPDSPDLAWVLAAQEALGDAAIDRLDPAMSGPARIEALREVLESVPDHERLHQALAAALREAAG
jgi:hypothetical protein